MYEVYEDLKIARWKLKNLWKSTQVQINYYTNYNLYFLGKYIFILRTLKPSSQSCYKQHLFFKKVLKPFLSSRLSPVIHPLYQSIYLVSIYRMFYITTDSTWPTRMLAPE